MRILTLAAALTLLGWAPPAVAQTDAEAAAESTADRGLGLRLEDAFEAPDPFDPDGLLVLRSDRELRMALWNADLGRLHYHLGAESSMLGREGLVGGGRMLGVGLGTTAIGDGNPVGLGTATSRARWSELSRGQKLKAGFEVTVSVGILAAIIDGLD